MMQKLVFVVVAGAASLFASTGLFAADDLTRKLVTAESFTKLDRNGDQRISRSEAGFDRRLSQTFAELDTDGDGFVSMTEYTAAEKRGDEITTN